ncbi:MAG: helix-hairpin-helix domain-containing protein [Fidelibacterota bacterium]|nr:MAG: helix-hairpin-helix domain-containing protein [Candidatus Neomarinimicrobiota bacterium]
MKLFTREEKRVLLYLSVLLFAGLLVRQGRNYFSRPTASEAVERRAALEAFNEDSRRYLAAADSESMELWAAGLVSPIDLNQASEEKLQALPGIGPVLAKKIVDYRDKNGYFRTVQDLVKIKGIGPKSLLRWEGLITVLEDTIRTKGKSVE